MLKWPDRVCFRSLQDSYPEWPCCLSFPPQRLCHCQQSTWHNEWATIAWARDDHQISLKVSTTLSSIHITFKSHLRVNHRWISRFSPCLQRIVRLRLHFRNDVPGNRVCWAVGSGCMILPAWLKSARELLPVPVHLLQLLVWSILDSFAQGCVCILAAESHRNKKKRGGGIDNVQIIYRQSCKFPRHCALGDAVDRGAALRSIQAQQIWNYANERMRSLSSICAG